ncbi:MAG: discoidin domain-containing protein [Bacteroidaceae bacterium]|nr:discoidin domain-containing protein [Bacteroidaceae bacterium]
MKKLYTTFALALMLVIGAGLAYAGYKQGDNVRETSDLQAGDMIYMKGKGQSADKYLGVKKNNSGAWILSGLESNVGDDNVFELVDANQEINGVAAYYLKSVSAQQYIAIEGILVDEPHEYTCTLTSNVSEAAPFAIKNAGSNGSAYMVFETVWSEMTLQLDDNYVNGVWRDVDNNHPEGTPILILSDYFNGVSVWWDVSKAEEATDLESYLIELSNLYLQNEGKTYPAGDGPGCYPTALVEAFNTAYANANVDDIPSEELTAEGVKARLEAFKAAIAALEEAGPNPMVEGYYFIVSAMEWNDGGTKGIYTGGSTANWANYDTLNANYVWQFIKDGENWQIKNLGQGKYIHDGATSVTVKVNDEPADPAIVIQDAVTPGAFVFGMNGGTGSNFIHCNGHASGAGTQSTIVLWTAGAAASQWYVLPVSQAQVEELDVVAKQNALNRAFATLLSNASSTYGRAVEYTGEDVTPEETAAYDSNAGMSVDHGLSWTEETSEAGGVWGTDGQGYSALFDKSNSTFFHTSWKEQPTDEDGTVQRHWLSIALPKAVNTIQFQMVQRGGGGASYNTPSDFDIEVSNDGATWTEAILGYNDYDASAINITTEPLTLGGDYTNLKLTVNHTVGANGKDLKANGGMYWNLSGLRIIANPVLSPTCQAATMPAEVVTNLKQAIATAKTVDATKVTQADIDALQGAYDAFVAQFADPTAFKALIETAKNLDVYFLAEDKVGANGADAVNPLTDAITDAEAFLATAFNAETLKTATDKLQAAIDAFKAQLIKPAYDKWYQIRVSDAETKEKYNWTYPDAQHNGKLMAVSKDAATAYDGDIPEYATLFAWTADDLEALGMEDNTYFRFINCGDSALVIQSKTGRFIHGGTQGSGSIYLSNIPTLFKVTPLGAGQNIITAFNIVTGAELSPIHLQASDARFVSWNTYTFNTRSALEIVEVPDLEVDEEEIGKSSITARAGEFTPIVFCSSISGIENSGALVPMGHFYSDDVPFIGFKEVDVEEFTSPAGVPFILLPDGAYNEEPTEADTLTVTFKMGSEFSNLGKNLNGLQGTFSTINAGVGAAILQTNPTNADYVGQWNVIKSGTKRIPAMTAYLLAPGLDITSIPEMDETEADVIMPIIGEGFGNSIKTVVSALKAQRAYTLNGVQVNLNNLQRGRIYIIDGRKVLIP